MGVDVYEAVWLHVQRVENLKDITPDVLSRASRQAIDDELRGNAHALAKLPAYLHLLRSLPNPSSAEAQSARNELRAGVTEEQLDKTLLENGAL